MKVYIDNPFQFNYLFSKEDINRQKLRWWERIEVFFLPTYVQISDGMVFFYKTKAGRYWIIKIEALMSESVK